MLKKILFIITKSEMGGASRFLFELANRLNKEEYDILVAAGPDSDSQNPGELLQKLAEIGIKTAYLPHQSNALGPKTVLAFLEIYKTIKNFKPDVLHLNSSEAGFLGALAGRLYSLPFRRKRPKIIYRIGGWAFKEPRNIVIKKIYLLAEKISAPFKDIIVTNSEFDRQLAIKNKIAGPQKIITIYNGIDLNDLNFLSKEEARKFLAAKLENLKIEDQALLGTIALFYKNKGLTYLVSATGRLKNSRLVIIGDGKEKERVENLIKKLGLKDKIFLTGYIPEAAKYLKAFDIFVLPSIKEGQPWVVLEAMAAGVPIVATNIAGIPEMIENGRSGLLVEPADSIALANAIERMAAHPSLAKECAENALTTVKEKFGMKKMIEETEKLF